MSNNPTPEKLAEWRERAKLKQAIVPKYFEVFPNKVDLICGQCNFSYTRPLVMGISEPVFVCPEASCQARNWVPVTFKLNQY